MKKKLLILSSLLMALSGCNDVPPSPVEPSTTPSTSETTSVAPSTPETSTTPSTPSVPDVPTFEFPSITSFITPAAYQSANPLKWGYQAKLDSKTYYIYMYQRIPANVLNAEEFSKDNTHVAVDIFGETSSEDIRLYVDANGKYLLEKGEALLEGVELDVKETTSQIEYRIKLHTKDEISPSTTLKFYSYDDQIKVGYSADDFIIMLNSYKYHTHVGDGWSVDTHSICFKDVSHYITPDDFQHPVPDKLKYHLLAEDEGLYIYVEQTVNQVITTGDQWLNQTHVEFSLYNHCVGMGLQYALNVDTYLAVWPNGEYYINNQNGLKAIDTAKCKIEGTKVTYSMFLRFNNNFDNPQDGPYAFVKIRSFDPSDNGLPYSNDDVVEYRDNRFVHTNVGNSVWVHTNGVDYVDNPYETSYLNDRKTIWNNNNFDEAEDLTLFIGDSYLESFNWWINFYTDYANKSAFTTAIGGTKTPQWLNWIDTLIGEFDANLKNIVIHLGYNDINGTQMSAERIAFFQKMLMERIHEAYPNVNIYTYGVGVSSWFNESGKANITKEFDALLKNVCDELSYATFMDVQKVLDDYVNAGNTLESFYKDGTHPTDENYKYFMDLLTEAGCVIANK